MIEAIWDGASFANSSRVTVKKLRLANHDSWTHHVQTGMADPCLVVVSMMFYFSPLLGHMEDMIMIYTYISSWLQLVCFFCRKVSMKEFLLLWRTCPFPSYIWCLISISTTNEFEEAVLVVYNSSHFYWGCTPLCGDFFFCTCLQGQWRASAFSCALDVGRLDGLGVDPSMRVEGEGKSVWDGGCGSSR